MLSTPCAPPNKAFHLTAYGGQNVGFFQRFVPARYDSCFRWAAGELERSATSRHIHTDLPCAIVSHMQDQQYTIRRATLNDSPLIAHLTRSAWANIAPPASSGHKETEDRVREDVELGGGLVLEVAGVPVGSVRWFPDPIADAWEVMRLGVVSALRGQGWGIYLMDEVARLAQASAVPELRIFVEVGQPQLVAWYEQQGFFVDKTPEYALSGTETPPIMLRKVLHTETEAHHQVE